MIKMNDGSCLMVREKDILEFLDRNHIIGSTITGIFPKEMNYGISNWDELMEEIDDISVLTHECRIQTDSFIFLELNHTEWLAIQFSGSGGPIIMNMVSGDNPYPKIPTDLFSLNTLFYDCRGKKIADVGIDRNSSRMIFPSFCGIDMSAEDEGVWRIRLILEDGNCLALYGSVDWFCVDYLDAQGTIKTVPMSWLQPNSPEAMAAAIDEGNYEKILALLESGVDYPIIDPLWDCHYIWTLRYPILYQDSADIRLKITEELLKQGTDPAITWEGEALLDDVIFDIFNICNDPETDSYLRRFLIRLIAYGGHTKYCTPQIKGCFDLKNLDQYRLLLFTEPDGYHIHGEIWDTQDNVVAIV